MKRVLFLLFGMMVLGACSDDNYTIEDARENEDIIVKHQTVNFNKISQGALEVENVEKINDFINDVEQNHESSVNISIFNPTGAPFQNTISYDGKMITFENTYGGYPPSPKGTYTCQYISKRGPIVYLESCESEKGEEFTTMIGLFTKD
ncbi:DUF4362 domain-containing protein [Salinibacillus xinjiangensis]|uniref:DUF4362 domain-containing protein n=1 Tax=Salinibacillus xinjiangensis TaxID=1229268 RepID=A0A6G1XA41_9BACI|nr:DUF4362 domain-containing protein [Salinibacillus xinjiangensis]MRG87873.1 DUF4362 domain-containing protein [Salinibacillus xinjiangensis]